MHTVTSRDGTGIAFDRFGKGPPAILLGGALQHRATRMDPSLGRLARGPCRSAMRRPSRFR
jgi:hypothetical protein